MSEAYNYFMIYDLEDSGERVRLNVTEEEFKAENGRNFLHPDQVLVIVKEDIRRIYIWKGATSSVRKRFISSRIAGQLQEELVNHAAFHRCKIISVDQGDEVYEFLNTFRFESMPVEEKLADMRYIRNIEREKMQDAGINPDEGPKFVKIEQKSQEHISSALQELEKEKLVPLPKGSKEKSRKTAPIQKEPYRPPPVRTTTPTRSTMGLSDDSKKKIMEKILKTNVPEGFKRQNLILGHTLYGAVLKKVNVFGKNMEETEWEPVRSLPKGIIEIENRTLRVYFDDENSIVEAVEVLEITDVSTEISKKPKTSENKPEKEVSIEETPETNIDYNSMTVKDLKNYADEHNIELPSSARKAEIINIIKEIVDGSNEKNAAAGTSKKRKLPEIPKG
jgi:hypothetical protein